MDGRPIPFTASEWQRVQSLFNSDSLEDLKECHIILTAWNHRIPMVAVVCCEMVVATLIGAKLELPPDLAYMKLDTMRRQCAIAVIRFVNYINEMGQPGGGGKPIEMKKATAPYGVPPWLVDMRHEATHNELPILERLQKGVSFARKWLWENFWTKPVHEAMKKAVMGRDPNEISIDVIEEGEIDEETGRNEDSASIRRQTRLRDLLLEYVEWRGNHVTFDMGKCGMMDRDEILIRIENALLQEPYDFYKVLLTDGFLILNQEQLEAYKDFDPYGEIPARVQMFWEPVAIMSIENRSLQFFIVECMERLRETSLLPETRAQLITWNKMLLDVAFGLRFSSRDWSSILSLMVALPGMFTSSLMKKVMDQLPELEEKRRRQVHRIMDISMHDEDGNVMEDSMTVKTIDDLKKAIERDLNKKAEVNRGMWSLSVEKDWRSIPLGMVTSQRFDAFSLIVDDTMLAKWGIVPSGPLNWNAVFDEQTPSSSAHSRDSVLSTDSALSGDSAPLGNGDGKGEGRRVKGRGNAVFAPPIKIGKRKSREGGGEDSFIESMKKKKKKKNRPGVSTDLVTID